MAAPAGLGINFSQDGTDITSHIQQLKYLKSLGINKIRVNIPTYQVQDFNHPFRDALRLICTTAKSMGFYVIWGYNSSNNFAAFKQANRDGAVWAASAGIDEWCVGNEEDLSTNVSQAQLRTNLKEVCQAIKVTDGFPGVVSTAITTNVYAAWRDDKANWKDYMTLNVHMYGNDSLFNSFAASVPGELAGANFYCGEFGVHGASEVGRLAFTNDNDWTKELNRRMKLLIDNGWPSYYYFTYAVGSNDAEEIRWSANRSSTVGETTLLETLCNVRPTRVNVGSTIKKVVDLRPLLRDFGTSLNFPGSSGVITAGTSNPFTGSFYYAAWMKWAGTNGNFHTLFAKRDTYASNGMMFSFNINTVGNMSVDTNVAFVNFSYTLPVNQWMHVVWVHDTNLSKDKLYTNGELVSNQVIGALGTKTDSLISIGACQPTPTDFYFGKMDEIVIGLSVPTDDEVYRMCKKGTNPGTIWRYYKLNEGAGTTAIDSSLNAVNGTISGATYSTDVVMKFSG